MIRNGKFNRAILVLLAIFAVSMLVSVNASALPPSEIITCQGCSLLQESVDKFSTWVKKDSTITLIGPAGYQSYFWTGGGQTVSGQSFTVKISNNVVYSVTLNGNKVKTVQVNLASEQGSCELELGKIEIDNTILVVGSRVPIKTYYNKNKCPDAIFRYIVDDEISSGVYIEKPTDRETWLVVRSKPVGGKNPIIRARITYGDQFREEFVMLSIGDNNQPMIKSLSTTPAVPLSGYTVTVNCNECFTGKGMNERGDSITEFSIRVKSLNGTFDKVFVKPFEINSKKAIAVSVGKLEEGFYGIEAKIKDSGGVYSETFFDIIFIGFGNTKGDAPYIKLNPIVCKGLLCVFDTSETVTNDLGLSRRYYLKTVSGYELMYNVNGTLCTAEICRTAFLKGDTYEIKIAIQYIRNGKPDGKIAEKTVIVCVGCVNGAQIPFSTSPAIGNNAKQPTATPVFTCLSEEVPDYRRKSSPGIGFFASIIILMIMARKIKNKY